jgi:uncharacterized sulfatase
MNPVRYAASLGLVILLLTCAPPPAPSAANSSTSFSGPPNILFVLVDDLGWMDLGVQGNPWYPTPNIDRVAREGMRFTDFYAPSPVCSPSRAAMMSGLNPAVTGITDFIPGHWRPYEELTVPTNRTQYLPTEIVTYAEALQDKGYATGYFGKWHLGWAPDQMPMAQGFDTAHVRGGWGHFVPPVSFTPFYPVDTGQYEPDILTDMTIDFIEDHQNQPFLAVLSHFAVHVPLAAPDSLIEEARRAPRPDDRVYNPTYVAMLSSVDENFGRLIDRLDELGLSENTLVVFTSDNGGLRQIFDKRDEVIATSNEPLRSEKGSLYEGGIRVPMFLRMPGTVRAGVSDTPATGMDLYPTFLEAAGGVVPAGAAELDGSSLLPVATEGRDLGIRDLYFHYPHYHHSRPAVALRRGEYKLIRFFDESDPELYNLAEDIGEQRNLASVEVDRTRRMLADLNAWLERTAAPLPVDNPDFDAERRAEWGPRPK